MYVGLKQCQQVVENSEERGDDPLRPEETNAKNDQHDVSGHFPIPSEQLIPCLHEVVQNTVAVAGTKYQELHPPTLAHCVAPRGIKFYRLVQKMGYVSATKRLVSNA